MQTNQIIILSCFRVFRFIESQKKLRNNKNEKRRKLRKQKEKRENLYPYYITLSCTQSIFSPRSIRESSRDPLDQRHRGKRDPIVKIDRRDEWPKFDQRTNLFVSRIGSLSREIFKNTRGPSPPAHTPPFFLLQIAFYKFLSLSPSLSLLSPFFLLFFFYHGALGFFSYPLAGHLPLRKGRPRCRIRKRGVTGGEGRRMRGI